MPARARLVDDVPQDRAADAAAAEPVVHAHRLELAALGVDAP